MYNGVHGMKDMKRAPSVPTKMKLNEPIEAGGTRDTPACKRYHNELSRHAGLQEPS
jgi:hypothetical protein